MAMLFSPDINYFLQPVLRTSIDNIILSFSNQEEEERMKTLETRTDDLSLLAMIKFSCYYLVAAGLQHLKTVTVLLEFL